jgi:hypothetical protein
MLAKHLITTFGALLSHKHCSEDLNDKHINATEVYRNQSNAAQIRVGQFPEGSGVCVTAFHRLARMNIEAEDDLPYG